MKTEIATQSEELGCMCLMFSIASFDRDDKDKSSCQEDSGCTDPLFPGMAVAPVMIVIVPSSSSGGLLQIAARAAFVGDEGQRYFFRRDH